MTLFFTFTAHGVKGYVTVMTCSGLQLLALLWYLLAFLSGGAQGMRALTSATALGTSTDDGDTDGDTNGYTLANDEGLVDSQTCRFRT